MKIRPLLFIFSLCTSICHAQDELPTVVPDRPGYTDGTDVTPLHKIIWDNGFHYESMKDGASVMTLNSTIVRYGIIENVELRVGTDFLLYNFGNDTKPTFGIAPLYFGTKIRLYESHNALPNVGIRAELQSPHIGSKELLPSHIAPSLCLLFEHIIKDRFWICYNGGLEWDGETAEPQVFLALGIGGNITESLGAFIETYNYLHSEQNQFMTEFGFTWMPSHRVQLDIEADLDWKNLGKHFAIGCGVSWLIN